MTKFLKFALFSAVVLIGYAMWKFQMTHQRVIVSYGLVKAESRTGNESVVARTRLVRQGSLSFEEVELPSGFWQACDGDCADALRRLSVDLHGDPLDL